MRLCCIYRKLTMIVSVMTFLMASDFISTLPATNVTLLSHYDQVTQSRMSEGTTVANIKTTGGSRGRRRPLRPTLSISERIVPIQLVETYSDDHIRVPRRKQLRPQALFAALGKDFDAAWMSVDRPSVLVEEPDAVTAWSLSNSRHRKMMSDARIQVEQLFSSASNLTLTEVAKTRVLIEDWLMRKASCPVRYVWDDVGPLFWPRWIKRGECVNMAERSCSWPFGMQCVPAESVTIHLLRFHCRPRARTSQQASSRLPDAGGSSRVVSASVEKLRLKMKHMRQAAATAAAARHRQQRSTSDDGVEENPEVGGHDLAKHQKRFRCQWLKVPYPVTAECYCSC